MARGRFDQERALEVATRRLAFGIVQKGPALKCRYAVLCDFFAGYLQDILSNDWLKQLQREYELAKREREREKHRTRAWKDRMKSSDKQGSSDQRRHTTSLEI